MYAKNTAIWGGSRNYATSGTVLGGYTNKVDARQLVALPSQVPSTLFPPSYGEPSDDQIALAKSLSQR